MHWETIRKDPPPGVPPNLAGHDRDRAELTRPQARIAVAGLPGGGLKLAYEAVDRHAGPDHGGKIARDSAVSTVTYAGPARRTACDPPSRSPRIRAWRQSSA